MNRYSRIPFYKFLVKKFQTTASPSSCKLIKTILCRQIPNSALIPSHEFPKITTAYNLECLRSYSEKSGNSETEFDQIREVDKINLKFGEAREEIETAMESKETVYFNEEAECARDAVKEVLEMYEKLLEKLAEGERRALQRSMGLKIEQLKAELKQLDE